MREQSLVGKVVTEKLIESYATYAAHLANNNKIESEK